jgi:hypothetical protein
MERKSRRLERRWRSIEPDRACAPIVRRASLDADAGPRERLLGPLDCK